GLGGIGGAIARRGLALGMSVAGVRRRPERGGPPGVRWVLGLDALPRLAAESDCFVIAAPHTAATNGAVTRAVLAGLPADAIVVNVSRGTLVDEKSKGARASAATHQRGIEQVIKAAIDRNAADLHIKAGDVFRARIDGKLVPFTKQRLTPELTRAIAQHLIANDEDRARLDK